MSPLLGVALTAAALAASPGAVDAVPQAAPGRLVDGVPTRADAAQTYAVYLPAAYEPGRGWPLLLVFDPRARGARAAEIFTPAAEEHGWIVLSSNGTMSDGPWEVNVRAVEALVPEVDRFAVDPRRIYAAGFSGGAIVAWSLAQNTGAVAGIVSAGGRLPAEMASGEVAVAHYGATGRWDFNHLEMREIDRRVAGAGAPHRLEVFDGRHQWLPPERAAEAVRWFELIAMQRGHRPVDAGLVAAAWEDEMAAARRLEEAGDELAARRRYRVVAESFTGLRSVEPARRRLAALTEDPAVQAEEREEARWEEWERGRTASAFATLASLAGTAGPWTETRLAAALGVRDLERRSEGGGAAGDAAERVLAAVFTQLSFYLPRDHFAAGRYRQAAVCLAVAASIQPLPHVLYDLGAAEARLGHRRKAMAALEPAVAAGYADADHLAADEDYAPLREEEAFQAMLERLREARPAPPAP